MVIYQASVTIDGQEYKSLPVEVNVTDSVKGANSNSDEVYFDDDNIELIASISKALHILMNQLLLYINYIIKVL